MKYRYFSQVDFDNCSPVCSIDDMNPALMNVIDLLREYVGCPLYLNSAYRSTEYEISKGRDGSSSHCKGLAVDISCKSNELRRKILQAVYENHVFHPRVRLGIAEDYIHLDIDKDKPFVVWVYREK